MNKKDGKWVDKTKKINLDKNGYERGRINHSDLIHRQIAYEYIYKKNKNKHPKPFSEYVVHHIDGNKRNNDISNLQILTPREHEKTHGIIKDKKEKEIFSFEEKAREQESKRIDYISQFDLENFRKWEEKKPKKLRDNLIKELREFERRKEKEEAEEKNKREKRKKKIKIYFIIGFALILFSLAIFNNNQEDNNLTTQNSNPLQENPFAIPEIPKIEPIIVTGSKTDVIIRNNQDKDISLNVTYRIYSNWFDKDSTESEVFEVNAEEEKSFQVYFNDDCNTAPCSVSILNFEEVGL